MKDQEIKYAIWVEFDDEFTVFLDKKCKELEEYKIDPAIRPPHMTLTFVKTDNQEKLIEYTKAFIQENTVDIVVNSIGGFSGGVLFYAPKVSKELIEFQSAFCQGVSEFGELAWDLYYPGNWTPHIALTGELDDTAAAKAFSIMRNEFSVTNATIKSVVIKSCVDGEVVLKLEI